MDGADSAPEWFCWLWRARSTEGSPGAAGTLGTWTWGFRRAGSPGPCPRPPPPTWLGPSLVTGSHPQTAPLPVRRGAGALSVGQPAASLPRTASCLHLQCWAPAGFAEDGRPAGPWELLRALASHRGWARGTRSGSRGSYGKLPLTGRLKATEIPNVTGRQGRAPSPECRPLPAPGGCSPPCPLQPGS